MVTAVLLDIEGTTSSVSFVYDVLFPYARKNLRAFLEAHWSEPEVREICGLIMKDAGSAQSEGTIDEVEQAVLQQMDRDAKLTGLKQLQGRIWRRGFESGEIRAHVYPDTAVALKRWQESGKRLFIYSSGSIEAQKLFFRHTIEGDLSAYFAGYFDTTSGGKREEKSYASICGDIAISPEEVLFISDIEEELDAAVSAGLKTALAARTSVPAHSRHRVVQSFAQLEVN